MTDPSGTTSYVYDSLGRVTTKTQVTTASPTNKTFTVGHAFSQGRPSSVTYPSGRVITYGYNARGQVTSIAIDGTTLLSGATWEPFGPVSGWTWANSQVMSRTYDLDGRVKTYTLGPSTGTYADLSQVFGYDSLNRLISAQLAAGQTQGFTYDANSNRATATINGALTTYNYPSTSHKLSSLSGATTRSFTYDNAGNTTVTQSVTYVYDGRGRMKQAGTTTYLVNGLGQRVKKTVGTTETYFAYDEEGRLIGEYDGTGAAIQETVWLGDIPVGVIKPNTPSGFTAYYVWADHLGTPRMITDSTNVARWEWPHNDPFGNNLPNENPGGAGTFTYNLRFPGQYYDAETGKHYNYFRDYDAAIGRYLQSDLIGLGGGFNTYAYVDASPVTNFDPSGLITAFGQGGAGGGGHAGIMGLNFSCGGAFSLAGVPCMYCTVCVRIGPGLFGGAGFSTGLGLAAKNTRDIEGWSVGLGFDVGAGTSVGGSGAVGISGAPGPGSMGSATSTGKIKGRGGFGYGFSLGLEACRTKLNCKPCGR